MNINFRAILGLTKEMFFLAREIYDFLVKQAIKKTIADTRK